VTALNAANKPTPNYGLDGTKEKIDLSFIRCKPANGDDGTSSGTIGDFAYGSAESTNSKWGEVGTIDIKASSTAYLGLKVNIEGSSDLDLDTAPANAPENSAASARATSRHPSMAQPGQSRATRPANGPIQASRSAYSSRPTTRKGTSRPTTTRKMISMASARWASSRT